MEHYVGQGHTGDRWSTMLGSVTAHNPFIPVVRSMWAVGCVVLSIWAVGCVAVSSQPCIYSVKQMSLLSKHTLTFKGYCLSSRWDILKPFLDLCHYFYTCAQHKVYISYLQSRRLSVFRELGLMSYPTTVCVSSKMKDQEHRNVLNMLR